MREGEGVDVIMLSTHGMSTKLGISAVRLQLCWDGLGLQGLAGSGRLNLETAVGGGARCPEKWMCCVCCLGQLLAWVLLIL